MSLYPAPIGLFARTAKRMRGFALLHFYISKQDKMSASPALERDCCLYPSLRSWTNREDENCNSHNGGSECAISVSDIE